MDKREVKESMRGMITVTIRYLKKYVPKLFHYIMQVLVISFGIAVGIGKQDDHSLFENTLQALWIVLHLLTIGVLVKTFMLVIQRKL